MTQGTEGMTTEEGAVHEGDSRDKGRDAPSPKAALVPLMVMMTMVTALTGMKKMMMKSSDAE